MKAFLKEFGEFLKEYKIISLAIAFVLGVASTAVVNSLVKDVLMPILAPLLGAVAWQDAMLNLGPIHIAYGSFLGELINFIVIAFVLFVVAKILIKKDKEEKKGIL